MNGLFRDEFANFLIKSRKLVSKDSAILRIAFPMLKDSWGEDFVPIEQFPKSFCVMAGKSPNSFKPYTPIDVTEDYLDLLVKGYKTGKVSSSLFESKEGDRIVLKGPREKLNVKILDKEQNIVAFAGGTGIAPIYQVLKYQKESNNKNNSNIRLFYANKTRDDILLKEELDKLLLEIPGLEINNIIESERGYISESDLKELNPNDYILICGPKGFNDLLLGNKETGQIGLLNKIPSESERIYKF
jgi:cytochrome-b5 reductase